jgi:cytochrome oxidase Cu insertion factor (SCO1/SenC/PrrC family)
LLLLLLAIAAPAGADPSFGLAVGEKAPEFELTDQKGEAHTLSSLLSRGKLAIVFYRSADW